ncbi:hypothetical protein SNEBB_009115 [Seison nebaliae]|nr:hypothetical protein SNEBB_009115 [Seison nebaliae]
MIVGLLWLLIFIIPTNVGFQYTTNIPAYRTTVFGEIFLKNGFTPKPIYQTTPAYLYNPTRKKIDYVTTNDPIPISHKVVSQKLFQKVESGHLIEMMEGRRADNVADRYTTNLYQASMGTTKDKEIPFHQSSMSKEKSDLQTENDFLFRQGGANLKLDKYTTNLNQASYAGSRITQSQTNNSPNKFTSKNSVGDDMMVRQKIAVKNGIHHTTNLYQASLGPTRIVDMKENNLQRNKVKVDNQFPTTNLFMNSFHDRTPTKQMTVEPRQDVELNKKLTTNLYLSSTERPLFTNNGRTTNLQEQTDFKGRVTIGPVTDKLPVTEPQIEYPDSHFCNFHEKVYKDDECPSPNTFDILGEYEKSNEEFRLDFTSFKEVGITDAHQLLNELSRRRSNRQSCRYVAIKLRRACCLGWSGKYCRLHGCFKPCMNGGYCKAPNYCSCPRGFFGEYCHVSNSQVRMHAKYQNVTAVANLGYCLINCQRSDAQVFLEKLVTLSFCCSVYNGGGWKPAQVAKATLDGNMMYFLPQIYDKENSTCESCTHAINRVNEQFIQSSYSSCIAFGKYEFRTFDGLQLSFGSGCEVILAEGTGWQITLESMQCLQEKTCSKIIRLKLGKTSIIVNRQGIKINERLINPTTGYDNDGIVIERSSNEFTYLTYSNGVKLKWNNDLTLYITLENSWVNRVTGLCGNFDKNMGNDLTLPNGSVEKNLEIFFQSWQTNPSCEFVRKSKNICFISHKDIPNLFSLATESCSYIYQLQQSKFYVCFALTDVNVDYWNSVCKTFICNALASLKFSAGRAVNQQLVIAQTAKETRCEVLSLLSNECSARFVTVNNWRIDAGCQKQCPGKQIYSECASRCPRICQQAKLIQITESEKQKYHMSESKTELITNKCFIDCSPGCECPPQTYWDEAQSMCVPLAECSCSFLGKTHLPNAIVPYDCNTCKCIDGAWKCTEKLCSKSCTLTGSGHIQTFDGTKYFLNGTCEYTMVQYLQNNKVSSSPKLRIASTINAEDIVFKGRQLIIEYLGTVVHAKGVKGYMRVNNQLISSLPHYIPESDIYIQQPTSHSLTIESKNWKTIMTDITLEIRLAQDYARKVHGLCGNYDSKPEEELEDAMGISSANIVSMANHYRTYMDCASAVHTMPMPNNTKLCTGDISVCDFGRLRKMCDNVNLDELTNYCKRDVCYGSTTAMHEYYECRYFAIYAGMCRTANENFGLTRWLDDDRYKVVRSVCTRSGFISKNCIGFQNRFYTDCATSDGLNNNLDCESSLTCRQRSLISLYSSNRTDIPHSPCNEKCLSGCVCNRGYHWNLFPTPNCVTKKHCSCYDDLTKQDYLPGTEIRRDCERCTCLNGQWRCESSGCFKVTCPNNLVYRENVLTCPKSCNNRHIWVDCKIRTSMCTCPDGYILAKESNRHNCVRQSECPCLWSGKEYQHQDLVKVNCQTCTCANGEFEDCSNESCPNECSLFGDGQFRTFDNAYFTYGTSCSLLLSKTDDNTLTIYATNVACGTQGITCSKSLDIEYHVHPIKADTRTYKIQLTNSLWMNINGKIYKDLNFTSIHYPSDTKDDLTISKVGALIHVWSPKFEILWDGRTRIQFSIDKKYQNRIQGVCGNFNGNSKDDLSNFAQQTNIRTAIRTFKLDANCPEREFHRLNYKSPCELQPQREEWAKMHCKFIQPNNKLSVFSKCLKILSIQLADYMYRSCLYDTCTCDKGGDCECYCTVLAELGQICNEHGLSVSWRTRDRCPMQCPPNSYYHPCGSYCPERCSLRNETRLECRIGYCTEGCFCNDGYILDHYGNCVLRGDCTCYSPYDGFYYQSNVRIRYDCHDCVCRNGQFQCQVIPDYACRLQTIEHCKDDEYRCRSYPHNCIAEWYKCDGVRDCIDGSDEDNCTCAINSFHCQSGQCIDLDKKCDGIVNCRDGSDENSCQEIICHSDKFFLCANSGICIPLSWKCDGQPDCGIGDNSDEENCKDPLECDQRNGNFLCVSMVSGQPECITLKKKCDGHVDCRDGSDENNCECRCDESAVNCRDLTGECKCIPPNLQCDGTKQCTNGEDEKNCGCDNGELRCVGLRSVSNEMICAKLCNSITECRDGRDENLENCPLPCTTLKCAVGASHKCIPFSKICDGKKDCNKGEDEDSSNCRCKGDDKFLCSDGDCIKTKLKCDGIRHCSDDELMCGETRTTPVTPSLCKEHLMNTNVLPRSSIQHHQPARGSFGDIFYGLTYLPHDPNRKEYSSTITFPARKSAILSNIYVRSAKSGSPGIKGFSVILIKNGDSKLKLIGQKDPMKQKLFDISGADIGDEPISAMKLIFEKNDNGIPPTGIYVDIVGCEPVVVDEQFKCRSNIQLPMLELMGETTGRQLISTIGTTTGQVDRNGNEIVWNGVKGKKVLELSIDISNDYVAELDKFVIKHKENLELVTIALKDQNENKMEKIVIEETDYQPLYITVPMSKDNKKFITQKIDITIKFKDNLNEDETLTLDLYGCVQRIVFNTNIFPNTTRLPLPVPAFCKHSNEALTDYNLFDMRNVYLANRLQYGMTGDVRPNRNGLTAPGNRLQLAFNKPIVVHQVKLLKINNVLRYRIILQNDKYKEIFKTAYMNWNETFTALSKYETTTVILDFITEKLEDVPSDITVSVLHCSNFTYTYVTSLKTSTTPVSNECDTGKLIDLYKTSSYYELNGLDGTKLIGESPLAIKLESEKADALKFGMEFIIDNQFTFELRAIDIDLNGRDLENYEIIIDKANRYNVTNMKKFPVEEYVNNIRIFFFKPDNLLTNNINHILPQIKGCITIPSTTALSTTESQPRTCRTIINGTSFIRKVEIEGKVENEKSINLKTTTGNLISPKIRYYFNQLVTLMGLWVPNSKGMDNLDVTSYEFDTKVDITKKLEPEEHFQKQLTNITSIIISYKTSSKWDYEYPMIEICADQLIIEALHTSTDIDISVVVCLQLNELTEANTEIFKSKRTFYGNVEMEAIDQDNLWVVDKGENTLIIEFSNTYENYTIDILELMIPNKNTVISAYVNFETADRNIRQALTESNSFSIITPNWLKNPEKISVELKVNSKIIIDVNIKGCVDKTVEICENYDWIDYSKYPYTTNLNYEMDSSILLFKNQGFNATCIEPFTITFNTSDLKLYDINYIRINPNETNVDNFSAKFTLLNGTVIKKNSYDSIIYFKNLPFTQIQLYFNHTVDDERIRILKVEIATCMEGEVIPVLNPSRCVELSSLFSDQNKYEVSHNDLTVQSNKLTVTNFNERSLEIILNSDYNIIQDVLINSPEQTSYDMHILSATGKPFRIRRRKKSIYENLFTNQQYDLNQIDKVIYNKLSHAGKRIRIEFPTALKDFEILLIGCWSQEDIEIYTPYTTSTSTSCLISDNSLFVQPRAEIMYEDEDNTWVGINAEKFLDRQFNSTREFKRLKIILDQESNGTLEDIRTRNTPNIPIGVFLRKKKDNSFTDFMERKTFENNLYLYDQILLNSSVPIKEIAVFLEICGLERGTTRGPDEIPVTNPDICIGVSDTDIFNDLTNIKSFILNGNEIEPTSILQNLVPNESNYLEINLRYEYSTPTLVAIQKVDQNTDINLSFVQVIFYSKTKEIRKRRRFRPKIDYEQQINFDSAEHKKNYKLVENKNGIKSHWLLAIDEQHHF